MKQRRVKQRDMSGVSDMIVVRRVVSKEKPDGLFPADRSSGLLENLKRIIKARESVIYVTYPGPNADSFYEALDTSGYNIKTLNFDNLLQSVSWNPFRYIHDRQGVLSMTDALFNSIDKHEQIEDGVLAAKLLVSATIASLLDLLEYLDNNSCSHIVANFNEDEANLKEFAKYLGQAKERNRNNNDYISKWQERFLALSMFLADSFSASLYSQYLQASKPKILPGIDIAMKTVEPIVSPLVQDVFYKDDTGLDRIREQRHALIVVRPKWESNYVPLFNLACFQICDYLTTPLREEGLGKRVNLVIGKDIGEMILHFSLHRHALAKKGVTVYENA